jgi:hypothetical protein
MRQYAWRRVPRTETTIPRAVEYGSVVLPLPAWMRSSRRRCRGRLLRTTTKRLPGGPDPPGARRRGATSEGAGPDYARGVAPRPPRTDQRAHRYPPRRCRRRGRPSSSRDPLAAQLAALLPPRAIIETPDRAGLEYRDLGLETDDRRAPARLVDRRAGGLPGPSAALPRQRRQRRRPRAPRSTAHGHRIRRLLFDFAAKAAAAAGRARRAPTATPARRGPAWSSSPRWTPRASSASASRSGAPSRWFSRSSARSRVSCCSQRSAASANSAACTTRSSRGPSSRTPTRPCAASTSCTHRSWSSTATVTTSCRSRRAEPCSRPPTGRSACTGLVHNDLVPLAGAEFARVIAAWVSGLQRPPVAD